MNNISNIKNEINSIRLDERTGGFIDILKWQAVIFRLGNVFNF